MIYGFYLHDSVCLPVGATYMWALQMAFNCSSNGNFDYLDEKTAKDNKPGNRYIDIFIVIWFSLFLHICSSCSEKLKLH